jgi:hypothetical protein
MKLSCRGRAWVHILHVLLKAVDAWAKFDRLWFICRKCTLSVIYELQPIREKGLLLDVLGGRDVLPGV